MKRAFRWWLWCHWFRKHKWRTLWNFRTSMPEGYLCSTCGRISTDLAEPMHQGQVKGWMR